MAFRSRLFHLPAHQVCRFWLVGTAHPPGLPAPAWPTQLAAGGDLAADAPWSPNGCRQVALLIRALPSVAAEDCFAMKGGTAINLSFAIFLGSRSTSTSPTCRFRTVPESATV
eukprot:gene35259-45172_t